MKYSGMILAGVLAFSAAASVFAEGHASDKALAAAVKARQSHMQLYSFNLGALGAMAKGEVAYDAATAQGAADNLVAVATLSQQGYWLPGTDSDTMENSRALPAIWGADSNAQQLGMDLAEAAVAMQAAAGSDLAGLQGAMKGLGDACSACHEDYRKPRD
jgi:cytochrome c556